MHYVHTLTIIMRNSLQKYYFYLYKRVFFAGFLKRNCVLLLLLVIFNIVLGNVK